MRPHDVSECAAFGLRPAAALYRALASSLWALTALVDDEPHAMVGVASLSMMEGIGEPWMLGTERIYDHGRDLVRHTPAILAEMFSTFSRLENIVSADNDRAISFIRYAGFELCDDVRMVGGVPFIDFAMERPDRV